MEPGVGARLGEGGPQRQRGVVRVQAVVVAPLVLVRDPEVVVRLRSVGLHRDRRPEAGSRLGGPPDLRCHGATVRTGRPRLVRVLSTYSTMEALAAGRPVPPVAPSAGGWKA